MALSKIGCVLCHFLDAHSLMMLRIAALRENNRSQIRVCIPLMVSFILPVTVLSHGGLHACQGHQDSLYGTDLDLASVRH